MTDRELFDFIDVEEMLTELGIRNVRDTHSAEIQYSCPFPGHSHLDQRPSASMSTVERPTADGGSFPKTSFHCFTCGMRGTSITFLSEYEGVSPVAAKRFLRERFVGDQIPIEGDFVQKINDLLSVPEMKKRRDLPVLHEREIDDRWVDWAQVFCEWDQTHNSPEPFCYMLDRGFEPETLMDFDIGYDSQSSRFSIPVRDHEGHLVGFKGRAWWPDARPKYLALGGEGYNFDTLEVSRVLFALDKAKQHTDIYTPLIIREGELNTMSMHEKGWPNTAGVSGCNLSRTQIELIKAYAESVIMYFDNFEDGLKAAQQLEMHMPAFVAPGSDKDPNDSHRDEIEALLKQADGSIQIGIRRLC